MRVASSLRRYSEAELAGFVKRGLAYVDGDTIVPTVAGASAALPLINNAEAQASGTTVTTANSGGTNADAYDAIVIGALATLTFDNTHAAHGTNAFKYTIGTTNQATYVSWTFPSTTEITGSVNYYMTANPSSTIRSVSFWGAGVLLGNLGAPNNTGLMQWKFPGDTSVGVLNNTALTLNQWNRIEFHVIFNATTGSGEARWFAGDATSQTGTDSTFTATNSGAACDEIRIGMNSSSTTVSYTWWMDDFKVVAGSALPIGPAPYTSVAAQPLLPRPLLMLLSR